MAARRLIFVLILMLMLSSFAAALVPMRDNDEDQGSSTSIVEPEPVAERGRSIEAHIDAAAKDPKKVRIRLGDQLTLQVSANRPVEIEIPRLGAFEDAEPDTPAHFDLLPYETGSFDVVLVGEDKVVGEIVVEPAKAKRKRDGDDGRGGEERQPTTAA